MTSLPESEHTPGRQKRVQIKYEPRDLWIGAYRDPANRRIYVCIVPCLPFVIHSPLGQSVLGLVVSAALIAIGVLVSRLTGGWSVGDYWTLGLGAGLIGCLIWLIPEVKRAPRRKS